MTSNNGRGLNDILDPKVNDNSLCNARDVLTLLGVSRLTLYTWVKVGKFPQPCKMPKVGTRAKLHWRVGDVRDWAREVGMLKDEKDPRQLEFDFDEDML